MSEMFSQPSSSINPPLSTSNSLSLPLYYRLSLTPESSLRCLRPFIENRKPIVVHIEAPPIDIHSSSDSSSRGSIDDVGNFVESYFDESNTCCKSAIENLQAVRNYISSACTTTTTTSGNNNNSITNLDDNTTSTTTISNNNSNGGSTTGATTSTSNSLDPNSHTSPNNTIYIGRNQASDIRIDYIGISSNHCRLYWMFTLKTLISSSPSSSVATPLPTTSTLEVYIVDVSRNGTWLNNKKIGKDNPVQIINNDLLCLAQQQKAVGDAVYLKVNIEPVYSSPNIGLRRSISGVNRQEVGPAMSNSFKNGSSLGVHSQAHSRYSTTSDGQISSAVMGMLEEWKTLQAANEKYKEEVNQNQIIINQFEEDKRNLQSELESANKTIQDCKYELDKCNRQLLQMQYAIHAEINAKNQAQCRVRKLEADLDGLVEIRRNIVKVVETGFKGIVDKITEVAAPTRGASCLFSGLMFRTSPQADGADSYNPTIDMGSMFFPSCQSPPPSAAINDNAENSYTSSADELSDGNWSSDKNRTKENENDKNIIYNKYSCGTDVNSTDNGIHNNNNITNHIKSNHNCVSNKDDGGEEDTYNDDDSSNGSDKSKTSNNTSVNKKSSAINVNEEVSHDYICVQELNGKAVESNGEDDNNDEISSQHPNKRRLIMSEEFQNVDANNGTSTGQRAVSPIFFENSNRDYSGSPIPTTANQESEDSKNNGSGNKENGPDDEEDFIGFSLKSGGKSHSEVTGKSDGDNISNKSKIMAMALTSSDLLDSLVDDL